jgi:glycosyltransferase involved in cell wall biosynthesis
VDLLLKAFDRLVGTGAATQLYLVGQEADLPLFLQGISSSARACVHYLGFRAPDKLPDVFSRNDVFVLPSRHDGWGVVVNQALGAGLPIMCSDAVGAGYDLVEPEINGLRFASEDEDGLFAGLKRFTDAPELCAQWGSASRQKARDWLPEAGAAKWVETMQQIKHSGT